MRLEPQRNLQKRKNDKLDEVDECVTLLPASRSGLPHLDRINAVAVGGTGGADKAELLH